MLIYVINISLPEMCLVPVKAATAQLIVINTRKGGHFSDIRLIPDAPDHSMLVAGT